MRAPPEHTLSRRALLGGGLLRGVRRRFDEQAAEPGLPPPPAWAAADWASLTLRSAGAVAPLMAALAPEPGARLLDLGASGNPLARAAADAGALVERAEPGARSLAHDDASFDAAGSLFGVVHTPDPRALGAELARVLRPGGRVALATWASHGALGVLLRLSRETRRLPPQAARPERWGSFEGRMLALDRFPGFATQEQVLTWRFAGTDELWHAVAAPLDELQRPAAEARLAPFVDAADGGLELRVEVVVATATLPG